MARDGPASANAPGRAGLLALAALGVVYGDIGTSPLYALREAFGGSQPFAPTPSNVLGVLSLVFWALVLIISVKYLALVVRADNKGEGGILSLATLAAGGGERPRPRGIATKAILLLGLFGAGLLFGEGIITPAISVLSAVEGVSIAAPDLHSFIVPITVIIIVALFSVQRYGTAAVARIFGPITLLWFVVLAALGVRGIMMEPGVLAAVSPIHAVRFFMENGTRSIFILGGVFLVVTGGESLYADMGHFGRRPIRHAWFALVLPALLLNYFGQGALLLANGAALESPFYFLAPSWALVPLIVLATMATIIASQAVISGAFSLTMQAVHLDLFPRVPIKHTSETARGQIYLPHVNWALMVGAVILVLGFGSSERLAGAYGISVNAAMTITTLLLYPVARGAWGWTRGKALALVFVFLIADITFLVANSYKIIDGGWIPLALAVGIYLVMTTWIKGRSVARKLLAPQRTPLADFLLRLRADHTTRVKGTAVFLVEDPQLVPRALLRNLKHNKVIHEHVLVVNILTVEAPRAEEAQRMHIAKHELGFNVVTARYGYMEEPSLPKILDRARARGVAFDDDTTYFLDRERFVATRLPSGMAFWREQLFALLSRNAQPITSAFHIPAERIVEVGGQVRLELPELIAASKR